jgi:tetratricopeptide (TPR) repeat protein
VETDRVALIRYIARDGTPCVGSGLLISESSVLTADHVADGQGHRVDCAGKSRHVSQVLRSGASDVDLAVLTIGEPVTGIGWLSCARIDRRQVGRVDGCVAVGFPRWKKDGDQRRSAQVEGVVPTAEGLEATADEGLRAGFLTLVGNRMPEAPRVPAGVISEGKSTTSWGGMSGAGVLAGNAVIGVVRSHNLAAGGQSLTVTPLTAIDGLPEQSRRRLWEALGVANPEELPRLPATTTDIAAAESMIHFPVRTLPRDIPDFTGRDAEVAYVMDALRTGSSATHSLAIHAVDGMAGIGKTSLAVHIGHQLASRYPYALFLDLRAHTQGQPPMDPGQALELLLTMLGVAAERIPVNFDQRAAQWRAELAMRRVLIILDNAVSAEQVEPLLPGASDSLVVITSRKRLIGLDGVLSLSLDTMKPADAIELFTRILGPDRVRAQPGPVAAAAIQCGYLPLAIRLVASWLSHHPAKSVNYVLNQLSRTLNPISTAFQLSYRDLSDEQQLMFRRLGLHPGQTFTQETAAALADLDLGRAQVVLDELYDRHLVEEPQGDRYRFHDLIREYARNLAKDRDSELDRREATNRLIEHYKAAVEHHQLIRNYKWFDDEMPELLSCAYYATEEGQAGYAWQLTRALAVVLQIRGLIRQARRLHAGGLEAARSHGDRRAQAAFHIDLSILDRHIDDRQGALHHSREALQLYEDLGDEFGQASAITEAGVIFREIGEYQNAREYLNRALGLYAKLGSGIGEGNAAGALGDLCRETGDYREAKKYFALALNLYTGSDDLLGAANVHFNLGGLSHLTGEYTAALDHLNAALALQTQLGNRSAQASANVQLGDMHSHIGDRSAALSNWKLAHSIYSEIESPELESVIERLRRAGSIDEPG